MKLEISKEWCVAAAHREGDSEVGAGALAADPSPLLYGIIDPDYARVFSMARVWGWNYGYSVLFHGSFTRDLDLVAVPWTAGAGDPSQVLRLIAEATNLNIQHEEPTKKEHGRLAWTLTFKAFGDPRFVDISFMPRVVAITAGDRK